MGCLIFVSVVVFPLLCIRIVYTGSSFFENLRKAVLLSRATLYQARPTSSNCHLCNRNSRLTVQINSSCCQVFARCTCSGCTTMGVMFQLLSLHTVLYCYAETPVCSWFLLLVVCICNIICSHVKQTLRSGVNLLQLIV